MSKATRSRDLWLLAGAVCLSALGDFLALITLALRVHDLGGSGLAVSALFAATMLPVVALAPLAGMIADRFDSRWVLGLASVGQALVAAGLALAGGLPEILVLSVLLATGTAISQPAEFALVPAAAGGRLTQANGTIEAARYCGFAVGPVLAAGLVATAGSEMALLVNAVSFLAIAAAAVLIRAPGRARVAEPVGGGPDRARDGIVHLWRDPVLRAVVTAATGALVFISASLTAEVFYVKDVLGAGDSGYALVVAAWMIGMVAGAVGLAKRVPPSALAAGALVALGIQGAGMAAQTMWAFLPAALAGYLVGGVGHGVKNTLVRSLLQQRVPERVHGRAFAAYNAARNTAELGALGAGGLLVSAIGPRPALLIAGLGPVLAAAAGLAALGRPHRRALRVPIRQAATKPAP